jgi:hypothetical protein
MVHSLFDVKSPDGFETTGGTYFTNEELAKREIENFAKRYEMQGYYSTMGMRISLDELKERCRIFPIEISQKKIDEYGYEIISV